MAALACGEPLHHRPRPRPHPPGQRLHRPDRLPPPTKHRPTERSRHDERPAAPQPAAPDFRCPAANRRMTTSSVRHRRAGHPARATSRTAPGFPRHARPCVRAALRPAGRARAASRPAARRGRQRLDRRVRTATHRPGSTAGAAHLGRTRGAGHRRGAGRCSPRDPAGALDHRGGLRGDQQPGAARAAVGTSRVRRAASSARCT